MAGFHLVSQSCACLCIVIVPWLTGTVEAIHVVSITWTQCGVKTSHVKKAFSGSGNTFCIKTDLCATVAIFP